MLAGKSRIHSHQSNKTIVNPVRSSICEKQKNERTKPISRNPKNRMLVQRNFMFRQVLPAAGPPAAEDLTVRSIAEQRSASFHMITVRHRAGICEKHKNERTKPISRKPKNRILVQRNFASISTAGDLKPLSITPETCCVRCRNIPTYTCLYGGMMGKEVA